MSATGIDRDDVIDGLHIGETVDAQPMPRFNDLLPNLGCDTPAGGLEPLLATLLVVDVDMVTILLAPVFLALAVVV